ncbi:hypothetical protein B0H15DRAFT_956911 [Mycena belliarum]|uniref:F-box domain-containing protein n=1 Tax=Mycena belliarum TaxID=1033014 RepID=A0AAD6TQA1_9AGAR|nr:hypothetical protein B0H15DRAFT_956911 [Mycena belliae]
MPPKKSDTNPQNGPRLARLPPELFDAIIETYETLPSTFCYTTETIDSKYFERSDALTALSQTCRTLREITLHRLWARLDICRVPARAEGSWYKYIMLALERKANGIADSPLRYHVRTLTLLLSKNNPDAALAALWTMLPKLPNLRTIHVTHCKTLGLAKSLADAKLELPNVTALFLPSEGSVFLRLCPNATHVRCLAGSGASLLSSLTPKIEVFDGVLDWRDATSIDRLVKYAPNLHTLELRRPVNYFSFRAITLLDGAALQGAQSIRKLAPLKKLAKLILTFPVADEKPGDTDSVAAARVLLRTGSGAVERTLVVQRVVAPHSSYQGGKKQDILLSSTTEVFY